MDISQVKKMVAKCIIPRINTDTFINDKNYKDIIYKLIDEGILGFCIFKGGVEEVSSMIYELQLYSNNSLIFSADLEYGLPMRFSGGTSFPHAMALGKTGDYNLSGIVGKTIAEEASLIGINWNFSPVADINSNKKNPIINIRSFGEDINSVSTHSVYYMKGSQSEGVLTCAKHFPGHGDCDVDSHLELPVLDKTISELEELELKPFINLINNGVDSIMIAHIHVKCFDDNSIPASLSSNVISYLRNKLGFKGLIISDALEMKAITNNYEENTAGELFFQSGGTIALIPENPFELIDSISEKCIVNNSLLNQIIENNKLINEVINLENLNNKIDIEKLKANSFKNESLALEIAKKSLELKIVNNVLPLNNFQQYAGFAFLQNEKDFSGASVFFGLLGQALENDCDYAFINEEITDEDIIEMRAGTEDAEVFIFPIFYKSEAYSGTIGYAEKISLIIKKITLGKPAICIYFGNPYLADEILSDINVLTYSDSLASIAATVMLLSGR